MKTIYAITGANGFLGNNIIRLLQNRPEVQIRSFVLPGSSTESLNGLQPDLYYGNILDPESLDDFLAKDVEDVLYVIHCAGAADIKTAMICKSARSM